jgi:hypothetical protein
MIFCLHLIEGKKLHNRDSLNRPLTQGGYYGNVLTTCLMGGLCIELVFYLPAFDSVSMLKSFITSLYLGGGSLFGLMGWINAGWLVIRAISKSITCGCV